MVMTQFKRFWRRLFFIIFFFAEFASSGKFSDCPSVDRNWYSTDFKCLPHSIYYNSRQVYKCIMCEHKHRTCA